MSFLLKSGTEVMMPRAMTSRRILVHQMNDTDTNHKAICIRRAGAKPPVFFVHEDCGTLLYVNQISRYIAEEIPIYGLPPVPTGYPQPKTIEGMAKRMVEMIRQVQPAGPYRIVGWRCGGLLAYEIAFQLMGADRLVGFVGLLDTKYAPARSDRIKPVQHELADSAKGFEHFGRIEVNLRSGTGINDVLRDIAEVEPLTASSAFAEPSMDLPESSTNSATAGFHRILKDLDSLSVAQKNYSAIPIPMPIHLFAAQDEGAAIPRLGWQVVLSLSQIRVIPVQGSHISMMAPDNIGSLGDAVSKAIESSENVVTLPHAPYAPVVTLQSLRSSSAPLFCIPGAGASVASYIDLIFALESRRQIFGFESRGLDSGRIPHTTVEAAVNCYLAALTEVHPSGPLHILGHSFGGWIALDMASRLAEEGREIASLIIIDSEIPITEAPSEFSRTDVLMAWLDHIELLIQHPLAVKRSDLESRSDSAQLQLLHELLLKNRLMPLGSRPESLTAFFQTFATALRSQFRPQFFYDGPGLLVLLDHPKLDQEENRREQERVSSGWERWARKLRHIKGPGNHLTTLKRPHVALLANLIETEMIERETVKGKPTRLSM